MARDFVFEALVLKKFPMGEVHRGVVFYTREQGLLTAVAHGAAKSNTRTRLLTSPFCRVGLKAYHDPVKDTWKVSDLEEREVYQGLSEDLGRYSAACLWAEVLIRAGAGESAEIFDHFAEAYSLLGRCPPGQLGNLRAQVLWRFLSLAGLRPDFSFCDSCGRTLKEGMLGFEPETGEVFCEACVRQLGPGRRVSRFHHRTIDRLLMAEVLDLGEALAVPLGTDEVQAVDTSARISLERLLGGPLKTQILE